jgi:creatinase
MLMERERLQDYQGNGEKAKPTFSAKEMQRRQDAVRKVMAELKIDAALFTSYHNICYLSDFLFCYFGRRYGLLIDHTKATSISAGIDGGQPWRRTFGNNVTYTDWQKDNYFHAVRGLTQGVKRLGIEFDHINLDTMALLRSEFPDMEFVDIAAPSMKLRMVKSAEEIAHITKMTRIADIGGAACCDHDPRDCKGLARWRVDGYLDMVPIRHQHGRCP